MRELDMELTMFERLQQLPLFQGMTTQEIADVMAHVRLDFTKHHAGDEIALQGDPCRQLVYIISGEVTAEYRDPAGRFVLNEPLQNVKVLEPYSMFGMRQQFSRTYAFTTEGETLPIEKQVMLRRVLTSDIAKINLLNMIGNRYQQALRLLHEYPDETPLQKIARFLLAHAVSPRGEKHIHIKMTDLAAIIHETRLKVSETLNELQRKEVITMQRGGFCVKDLQQMYK